MVWPDYRQVSSEAIRRIAPMSGDRELEARLNQMSLNFVARAVVGLEKERIRSRRDLLKSVE